MKLKVIVPAVTDPRVPVPALGLGTLMSVLDARDELVVTAEQAQQPAMWEDADVVVISVGFNEERACNLADLYRLSGSHVLLAGLGFGAMQRIAAHADTLFVGAAEELWPSFVRDFRNGAAHNCYMSEFTLRDAGFFVSPEHVA